MAVRQAGKPPRSPAEWRTYLLEPKNWLIVTVVGIGGHLDGLAGVGWGLLAGLFTAVLGAAAAALAYAAQARLDTSPAAPNGSA